MMTLGGLLSNCYLHEMLELMLDFVNTFGKVGMGVNVYCTGDEY